MKTKHSLFLSLKVIIILNAFMTAYIVHAYNYTKIQSGVNIVDDICYHCYSSTCNVTYYGERWGHNNYNIGDDWFTGEYISGYRGSSSNVIVPSTITINSIEYTVKSISSHAFENSYFSSCNLPSSLTSIGSDAFKYCSNLTALVIPESVSSIGSGAFMNCQSLSFISIPSTISSIGSDMFRNCNSLTAISLPNNITSIGTYAFFGCSNLVSVNIPTNVTSISESVFAGCSNLNSINIPNNVTSIGTKAFSLCSSLKSLNIPNAVTSIGDMAFYGCSGLTSISVASGNSNYDSRNNCNAIINKETNELLYGCMNTTIPNSVTTIGNYAFYECSNLASINIPNGVTSIGNYAFYGCDGLTSVDISNDLTTIGDYAFSGCSGLSSITIPNGVTSIGNYAFYNCSGLTSITIPNSVTSIAQHAFDGCSSLTSISISEGVTSIGNSAFRDCSNLTSVIIPNSVTSIESGAFSGCSGLTSITIPNSVKSIGSGAFSRCSGLTSISIPNSVTSISSDAFKGCNGLTSVTVESDNTKYDSRDNCNAIINTSFNELIVGCRNTIIPNGVTSIGDYAFYNCNQITSFTIPDSVTKIGSNAFYGCDSLTTLTCLNKTPPSLYSGSFTNRSDATLYVPASSKATYEARNYWKDFKIEAITYYINDESTTLNIVYEDNETPVTFTHNFNGEWEALYLPFAIDYNTIKADFDLAEIDGVVQNDDNNDGIVDFTVLSIIGFKEQNTAPNMPYLIRAKHAGEQTIHFEDITVYPTESVSLESSSISTRYEFTGSYNMLDASALTERYTIQNGELVKGASSLAPCRWYMTATAKRGSLNLPNKIRIMPVEDVITGIDELRDEQGSTIVNLAGQRLSKPAKGINIVGGKKVLVK